MEKKELMNLSTSPRYPRLSASNPVFKVRYSMNENNSNGTRTSTDERGGSMHGEKNGLPSPIELKHKDITDKILHAFFKIVYPQLGYGFLEKVYENALEITLQAMGIKVRQQEKIGVYFQNHIIGEYFADLLVEEAVIVEIKAVNKLTIEHEAQLLNYLRATPYEVGLLINFGPKPDFRRKVFDNSRKTTTWK
jgi:GxxExxY protein